MLQNVASVKKPMVDTDTPAVERESKVENGAIALCKRVDAGAILMQLLRVVQCLQQWQSDGFKRSFSPVEIPLRRGTFIIPYEGGAVKRPFRQSRLSKTDELPASN